MDNLYKGYQYEVQIKNYIINVLNKPAYLWKETPENILIRNNIIGSHNEYRLKRKSNIPDTGIDIIQIEDKDNLCSIVQCKNGYKNGISISNLAGFMAWMFSLPTINGFVYYTNKLSTNLRDLPKNDRIKYIKHAYIENKESNINIFKPYNYQIEAKNKFDTDFNYRGILTMPCGTGKTYTSYLISQNYKQIIIFSPLKQFAKQNLDKYIEYGYNNKTLLVDSDGERDIKEIKKFIKNNENFLISATFSSIDVIYEILKYLEDPLFIIDEFHNLSKNDLINEEYYFYHILHSDYKILFMSATPRVYELENEDYDCDDIFGSIIYNMSFTDAINNKYICDYKIWLPSIHEDNSELNNELSIYGIDDTIKSKCNYLFSCLLNNGSRKCIIYCINNKELNLMIDSINELNDFYCLKFDIYQITSKNTYNSRQEILDKFTNNTKIQLLFSIRILDECIDIPSCDSIYITYPCKSKIRTIQRLCRCIRINKDNQFKIGNIYIWCDEYNEILETLSGIKEYDIFFKDKININNTNFYNKSENIEIEKDTKLINNYVLGIKEFKQYTWEEKLELLKTYIDENDILPDKDTNKQLYYWILTQKHNYKNNIFNMKK